MPFKKPKQTVDEATLYDYAVGALGRRMPVEIRCFDEPASPPPGVSVRGYVPWDRVASGAHGPSFAPVLSAFSVGLAMARDPVDAHVVHAHTWYASAPGLLVRTLYQIPLVVTLHSLEPLRPWKADQLGTLDVESEGSQRIVGQGQSGD